jgi:hypothetical protein
MTMEEWTNKERSKQRRIVNKYKYKIRKIQERNIKRKTIRKQKKEETKHIFYVMTPFVSISV